MQLTIGWLFPELMSSYGDRGNVLCLQKRAEWQGIEAKVIPVVAGMKTLDQIDIFVGGGSQNRQQLIALQHLRTGVGDAILEKLHMGTPALFICGAMQLLGKSFGEHDGLGFFDCVTELVPKAPRLTGDLEFKLTAFGEEQIISGFENHAGYTYLGDAKPLGKVIKGHGNNGRDGSEGVFHKQAIGSYAHGPLLPKNPFLADWLLRMALEKAVHV